jgi:signal peptidase I
MPAGIASTRRSVAGAALLRSLDLLARAGLLVACLAFLGLGLLPRTGWYRPVTVLSGSMSPTFSAGDMVVVTPEPLRDVRAGQIISYRIPVGDHHIQSHRVIKVLRGGASPVVRTKGDANSALDPWTAKLHGTTAWRVRAVLPKLGWVVFWFRSPLVHSLTTMLAPLLLALIALAQIWRRPEPEAAEVRDDVSPAV